jgi:hypothetical protein
MPVRLSATATATLKRRTIRAPMAAQRAFDACDGRLTPTP